VFVNHELSAGQGSLYSLPGADDLTGARVSYFDINVKTRKLVDAGLAYNVIYRQVYRVRVEKAGGGAVDLFLVSPFILTPLQPAVNLIQKTAAPVTASRTPANLMLWPQKTASAGSVRPTTSPGASTASRTTSSSREKRPGMEPSLPWTLQPVRTSCCEP